MADTPPPEPNYEAALPRYTTDFGHAAAGLISLLEQGASQEDLLREISDLDTRFDDALADAQDALEWSDEDEPTESGEDLLLIRERAAEAVLLSIDSIERRILAGDLSGALADAIAAAYARDQAHVEKAYDLAMEQKHAV